MTDRINRLTVVLKEDIREDDAEPLINAILMIRGVIAVEKGIADPESFVALKRAQTKIRNKVFKALTEED